MIDGVSSLGWPYLVCPNFVLSSKSGHTWERSHDPQGHAPRTNEMKRTLRKRVWIFADIASLLLAMGQPCCQA